MNVFNFNNAETKLEINEPELFLIKEFKALLDRDKTKSKTRAFKELTYIYLALDWKSLYNNLTEQDRHQSALEDSGITESEFNDPIFREACRKYRSLQESHKSIQLLNAAKAAADKLIDYFTVIVDFDSRKEDGTPIFKAKDVITEMSNISKVHEELKILEELVQKDLQQKSQYRAGAEEDFDPGEF